MTTPVAPAPDNKKNNRKHTFLSIVAGVAMGAISMTVAACVTVIMAGAGGMGVPCLIAIGAAFTFDFVLHYARTDEFKLLPAIGAAAVTSVAIGFAFNAMAKRTEERRARLSAPEPTAAVAPAFKKAIDTSTTITYAAAQRLTRQAAKPVA